MTLGMYGTVKSKKKVPFRESKNRDKRQCEKNIPIYFKHMLENSYQIDFHIVQYFGTSHHWLKQILTA